VLVPAEEPPCDGETAAPIGLGLPYALSVSTPCVNTE